MIEHIKPTGIQARTRLRAGACDCADNCQACNSAESAIMCNWGCNPISGMTEDEYRSQFGLPSRLPEDVLPILVRIRKR